MPATGVYPLSPELFGALYDSCYCVSDRTILGDIVIGPIFDIYRSIKEGLNPFIGRERYRQWTEWVEESLGPIQLPDWDTLMSDEDWPWELLNLIEGDMEPQWELFMDRHVSVEDAVADLSIEKCELDQVLEKILHHTQAENYFLAVADHSLGTIYVIKSPDVEPRAECTWKSREGYHLSDHVADGEEPGPFETYVLPDDVRAEWQAATCE